MMTFREWLKKWVLKRKKKGPLTAEERSELHLQEQRMRAVNPSIVKPKKQFFKPKPK